MLKRVKIKRSDTPSLLQTSTTRKIQNRSVDISQMKQVLKVTKQKVNQILPLMMSADTNLYTPGFMYPLKESLTVKRVEMTPTRVFTGMQIATVPLHPKIPKIFPVPRINSFKSLQKPRKKSDYFQRKLKVRKSPEPSPKAPKKIKKNILSNRTPTFTPQPGKTNKTLPKISFKEACRIPSWILKAKPELLKVWRKIINRSNGIEPVAGCVQYKYFIGKGNNSKLVSKCFAGRPWWVEVEVREEAHYVWTQWKDKELLKDFERSGECINEAVQAGNMLLVSPINLKVEKNLFKMVDIEELGFQFIRNSGSYICLNTQEKDPSQWKMHNKLEFNQHLSNKKGLFKNLKNYYTALGKNVFEVVPLTFHIKKGESDPEFFHFIEEFKSIEAEKLKTRMVNLWIVKPGENTNRGQGITLASSLSEIKQLISSVSDPVTKEPRTYIIQKYIEKPLLLHKRKFDIRCYTLVTSINGIIQAYFYADGYLRTASIEYSVKDYQNNFIHLTNDAIQKYSEEYGKHEDANKLSYKDFQRYLDYHCSDKKVNFFIDILPQIKRIVKDSIGAVYKKIDFNKRLHCMEIFGYDFMIDSNLTPWLIEVNTNPCLELASNYLSVLIRAMVENALRVAVDPVFPPGSKWTPEQSLENKFELIFHQEVDGKVLEESAGENFELICKNEELSDCENYSETED